MRESCPNWSSPCEPREGDAVLADGIGSGWRAQRSIPCLYMQQAFVGGALVHSSRGTLDQPGHRLLDLFVRQPLERLQLLVAKLCARQGPVSLRSRAVARGLWGGGGAWGVDGPYRAYILGSVPAASRSMMGVSGLFFFMVGYARVRKDLPDGGVSSGR